MSAVSLVEQFEACSVALEHVQDVASDLDDLGFLNGHDRCASWASIQTSHFSEDDILRASEKSCFTLGIRGVRSGSQGGDTLGSA